MYRLGYETRGRSIVALQMKNSVSNFKALCAMNRHNSVTIRYRAERENSSESGILENTIDTMHKNILTKPIGNIRKGDFIQTGRYVFVCLRET